LVVSCDIRTSGGSRRSDEQRPHPSLTGRQRNRYSSGPCCHAGNIACAPDWRPLSVQAAGTSSSGRDPGCMGESFRSDRGQLVMSTRLADGEVLPLRNTLDIVEEVWATRQPQVSDVVPGRITRQYNAVLEYPTFKDGKPLYSISIGLNPERFLAIFGDNFSPDSVVSLLGAAPRSRYFSQSCEACAVRRLSC
jgi:hypothetical protein